jgi:hypothetical protein
MALPLRSKKSFERAQASGDDADPVQMPRHGLPSELLSGDPAGGS